MLLAGICLYIYFHSGLPLGAYTRREDRSFVITDVVSYNELIFPFGFFFLFVHLTCSTCYADWTPLARNARNNGAVVPSAAKHLGGEELRGLGRNNEQSGGVR